MTSLWIDSRHMTIRKYAAAATGPKAVVRVEFEVNDPGALGFFLKDIGDAQREVARERELAAEAAREAKRQDKGRRGIGQQKVLALPYFGSDKP